MTISYSFLIGDLLHVGHVNMFTVAKSNSDYHICGLLSDAVVDEWIDPKLCDFNERKSVLEKISLIDEVIEQDQIDPTKNLQEIHRRFPDAKIVLVKNHILGDSSYGIDFIQSINGGTLSYDFYPKLSRESIAEAFYNSLAKKRGKYELPTEHKRSGGELVTNIFSTKANTLQKLKNMLVHSSIEKEIVFTAGEWETKKEHIIEIIKTQFAGDTIVVRSSSLSEDLLNFSNAGHYHSVLNVQTETHHIMESVEQVIESYKQGKSFSEHDQILVQKQTQEVAISGVIFTRNLRVNTPYYLINYDDSTGKTDSVTSGDTSKKVEILRTVQPETLEIHWKNLLFAVKEIESIFQNVALDIEFAIKKDHSIVIFQVRPLAANSRFYSINDQLLIEKVQDCVKNFSTLKEHQVNILDEIYFSDMAFWNPAELIGDRPKFLDYSLFNHLIMKNEWSDALQSLGYTHVNDSLMVFVANKPYINLHHSFLTLTPENLPLNLKNKLLKFYNKKIKGNHFLHDKIEFEIVYNCFRFDFEESAKELLENDFTNDEVQTLRSSLFTISNTIFHSFPKKIEQDNASIAELDSFCEQVKKNVSTVDGFKEKLDLVHELIEQCKKNGIPAFVRAARFAFIGNALLKSLVKMNIISTEIHHSFLNTIPTVATEMDEDFTKLKNTQISIDTFLLKYWHLRPGTYDITKLPYEKNPAYFSTTQNNIDQVVSHTLSNKDNTAAEAFILNVLDKHLGNQGFTVGAESVIQFIKQSIQLREYYKFVYTKAISLAIELIADLGTSLKISRNDLAYLDYYSIVNHRTTCTVQEITDIWKALIENRKQEFNLNSSLSLPPMIFDELDFSIIHTTTAKPNFITDHSIIGEIFLLDSESSNTAVTDKIVVIEKADPGYDWIFTQRIKGLITKYGGAASHMAIRCAEFDIPAAIGCGDIIFTKVIGATNISLDCKNKMINVL